MSGGWRLGEIATRFGLELRGDATLRIDMAAAFGRAGAHDITYLARGRTRIPRGSSRAGAVIVAADDAHKVSGSVLLSDDPALDFARIATLFERPLERTPGIHASAVIEDGARVSPQARIGPHCWVAADAEIAAGALIGAGCQIGPGCRVGPDCRLLARVTLVQSVRLGARVLVHAGAVLGDDGFGLVADGEGWIKVPQLGGLLIGDDCEIGANTCIDRGALSDTVLEHDVRLDNLVHIAHNVHVGAHTAMAGCAAVAGSTRIGQYCQIGGGAGIVGHIHIADRVTITARTLVTHSIDEPGTWSSGTPLQENRLWRRNAVRIRQLDELARRVKKLEKDTGHD